MLKIFLILALLSFPPNYHCLVYLLQVNKLRHKTVTFLPQRPHRNKSQRRLQTMAMDRRLIRNLEVNLSLEQEVLPGDHWHWSPCPRTASLSRNGCVSPSSWPHFCCSKCTLLQILRARNRTGRVFQKKEQSSWTLMDTRL